MGIDGGQTKTSCILAGSDGSLLGEGKAGPVLHLAMQGSQAQFLESVGEAVRQAWVSAGMAPESLAAVALGLTGVTGGSVEAEITAGLARRLVDADTVVVESDVFASLLGAHAGSEGIVVVSGTGSIAMGINATGQVARSGGWGWIIGDEGSACWIGRYGLLAALRAFDQTGPTTQLLEDFKAHFNVQVVHDIKRKYMATDFGSRGFGTLAPVVAAAAQYGDGVALRIMDAAADELALAALTLLDKIDFEAFPVRVAAIGGAFEHLWGLKGGFEQRLQASGRSISPAAVQFPPRYGPLFLALRACAADLDAAIPNLRRSLSGAK